LVRDGLGQDLVESLGATAVFGSVENDRTWAHANGTDAIVHSAAIITTRRNWDTFEAINANGAKNAALTAAKRGIRLVHISSVAVYGRGAGLDADYIDENTEWAELLATEFYARSKRSAEETVAAVAQETGLSAVSLRPCVIYGERDRTFLPHVVRILKHGYAPLVGTGTNSLSVVYAGNVADAVLAALEHPDVTGPINVTNDGDVTQREFLTSVGAALGTRTRLVRVPVPAAYAFAAGRNVLRKMIAPKKYSGFGASAVRFLSKDNPYTSERARRELEWQPTTPPAEAIERSIRWFKRLR
jgi:nucleoside-diphosphate-sugar epimerase